MNKLLAIAASLTFVSTACAQQTPMIGADAGQPAAVTMAYLLLPNSDKDVQLYFGEAALQADDKISFSAMWEIGASVEKCTTTVSDYAKQDLLFSDIVLVGAPDSYDSADEIVTEVTTRLMLSAGQYEVVIPDALAECQAKFLATYHTLKEDE